MSGFRSLTPTPPPSRATSELQFSVQKVANVTRKLIISKTKNPDSDRNCLRSLIGMYPEQHVSTAEQQTFSTFPYQALFFGCPS